MIYKHKHFNLDTKSRKIFDENFKELRLTGNAYRVLVFLCENGSSTVTDIGDYLDQFKDYDENHLRQYRYKINTIIGYDVVEYKNNVYSLVGELKKSDKLEKNNRNTDLLRQDNVKLRHKDSYMQKLSEIKFSVAPAVIAVVFLLLTFLDWHSYGFYTFMKFIVTGVMIYYAYYIYEKIEKMDTWFWITVAIAILFNPVIPIYLKDKSMWMIIDVVVIIFLISLIFNIRKYEKNI